MASCKAENESNDEQDDHPLLNNHDTPMEFGEEKIVISEQMIMEAARKRKRRIVNDNGTYECDQCHKAYSHSSNLWNHKQSVHAGVKYA